MEERRMKKIGGDGGANDVDNNDTLDCCKSSLTLSCVSDLWPGNN